MAVQNHLQCTVCNDKRDFFTDQKVCDHLHYLLNNVFNRFGSNRRYSNINCAHLIADCFCFLMNYFVSFLVLQSSRRGRERELVALLLLSYGWLVLVSDL